MESGRFSCEAREVMEALSSFPRVPKTRLVAVLNERMPADRLGRLGNHAHIPRFLSTRREEHREGLATWRVEDRVAAGTVLACCDTRNAQSD
jgi:hypothetical protein